MQPKLPRQREACSVQAPKGVEAAKASPSARSRFRPDSVGFSNFKMNHPNSTPISSKLYLIATIGIAILFAILIGITPAAVDDMFFLKPVSGSENLPQLWPLMCDRIPELWESQSGRLGNFVATFFLFLFPRWVFGILSGGVIAWLLYISCRLSGSRPGAAVSWLIMAVVVFVFPWYDYLTQITYCSNYVWAATASLSAIFLFLRFPALPPSKVFASCLLLFIAGWFHEGFGAPLACGLGLYILWYIRNISLRQIAGLLCEISGTAITFLSPTFRQRGEQEGDFIFKFTYQEAIMQLGPALLMWGLFILLILIIVCSRRRRRSLIRRPAFIIILGFCMAASMVFLKFYNGPRTGAPLLLFSAIGLAICFNSLWPETQSRSGSILRYLLAVIIGGGAWLNLAYADIAQFRLNREIKEVMSRFKASKDGVFYYNLSYPAADLSLFKTSVRQFHERVPKNFMEMVYGKRPVILPEAMHGFNPSTAPRSSRSPEAMIYNGWIIVDGETDVYTFNRIHVLTTDGRNLPTRFRYDFFPGPDSRQYIIITPHVKVLDPSLPIADVILSDHSR